MSDDIFAFRPGFSGVESFREANAQETSSFGLLRGENGPFGVNDGAHVVFDFLGCHSMEFGLGFGGPGAITFIDEVDQGLVIRIFVLNIDGTEAFAVGFVVTEKVSCKRVHFMHLLFFFSSG